MLNANLGELSGLSIHSQTVFEIAGQAVDFGGDLDDDGIPDLLVGAPTANNGLGAVYVFLSSDGGLDLWFGPEGTGALTSEASIAFVGAAAGDQSGRSVAFVGDVDGDGIDDFALGAPFNDEGSSNGGKA